MATDNTRDRDRNEDPITGEAGAHPIGSGLGAALGGAGGAAAGAAAGAALGGVAGPIGVAAGAVVGGLVGGLAGKGVAEWIDPTEEHAYWQNEYRNRDYVDKDADYDRYAPAYQYGWESYTRHNRAEDTASTTGNVTRFEDVESDLGRDYETSRRQGDLSWHEASGPARDAWNRVAGRDPSRSGSSTSGMTGAGSTGQGLGTRAANAVDRTLGTDINDDGVTRDRGNTGSTGNTGSSNRPFESGGVGASMQNMGNRAANAIDRTLGTDINSDGVTSQGGGSAWDDRERTTGGNATFAAGGAGGSKDVQSRDYGSMSADKLNMGSSSLTTDMDQQASLGGTGQAGDTTNTGRNANLQNQNQSQNKPGGPSCSR